MSSGHKRYHSHGPGPANEPSRTGKRCRGPGPDGLSEHHEITPDKYTVGWVCALPLEMAAAKGMLDKLHPNPTEQDPRDHNTYLLGEVCGHNVVVACLPAGIYGTTPAATVAKDMLRTFKSIRFGLMVGIGGGIPSKSHDIRLGDVVVGQPTVTNGGVIQYDRGKRLQEQGFERTGTLNTPPQVLLAALSRLQAEHLTEDSRVAECLAGLPQKMKTRFSHPGVYNDSLFLAKYPHIDDNPTCEQCDRSQTVNREDRDDTDPVIHYGTIASGNQVIKDATIRDQLGKELGALCFEMEAAGLQDFPSIVIRGICDYSDSHKNKKWQLYAAAVAAAFAKELLSLIPPSRVLQEDPIPQLVSIANENLEVSKQHLDVSSRHYDLSSHSLDEHRHTNQILEDRSLDIHVVHEARYDSDDVGCSPRCEANTRVRIQQSIKQWADDDTGESFLWLVGPAGTGKSTLVRSVADSFHEDRRLVAGYFFKRGEQGRNDTNRLFSTLAVQLADNVPHFKRSLRRSLGHIDRDSLEKKDLRFQFEKLLQTPLKNLPGFNGDETPKIIILDALDECERPENLSRVLAFVSEICKQSTALGLRVLLTSRPNPQVVNALDPLLQSGVARQLKLHRAFVEDTKADIKLYLETNFTRIRTKANIQQDPWPALAEVDHLVELSTRPEPLFIYAATLVRFVYDEKHLQNPKNQLKIWLKQCQDNKSQLHQMYNPILEQIFAFGKDTDFDKQLQFLGALILTAEPLSLTSLTSLLALDVDDVNWWLPGLHAVLDIPSEPAKPIRVLHKSFSDFLFNTENEGHAHFQLDASETHVLLAVKSIELMERKLKRDVCHLQQLDAKAQDIDDDLLDRYLPPELRYSCLNWVHHLQAGSSALKDYDGIDRFLLQHFLHWLEVLATLGQVSDGFEDLQSLTNIIKQSSSSPSGLDDFLRDAIRTILSFASIIESAPLQTYASLLLFSPVESRIRQHFWDQRLPPNSHIEGVKSNWGAHLQTLAVTDIVTGLAFSPDGRLLASADSVVRVWNTSTGNHLISFEADERPMDVAFSPNSNLLAATYFCDTVRIWDRTTWKSLQTIECSDAIITFSFSPNNDALVIISADSKIRIWSVRSGILQKTANLPIRCLLWRGVSISPSLEQIALYSAENTILLWSLTTNTIQHTFDTDGSDASAIGFSPDGGLLAAEYNRVVSIWDTRTYTRNYTVENSRHSRRLCFSSSGQLASVSDRTARIWNLATGTFLDLRLEGIDPFTFSSDGKLLATASNRKGVTVWDFTHLCLQLDQPLLAIDAALNSGMTSPTIINLLFSPNGKFLASQLERDAVQIWDSLTGKYLRSLMNGRDLDDIQFSPDSKLLACRAGPSDNWIWDVEYGIKKPMNRSQMNSLNHPVVYHAESHLAAVCWDDDTLNLFDTTTGSHRSLLQSKADIIRAATFSPNGSLLATLSGDGRIQLWDTEAGTRKYLIQRPEESRWGALAFSPDGKILSHNDGTSIDWWDVASGLQQHTLQLVGGTYREHGFSPNSCLLAASCYLKGSGDKVSIYNAKTGKHQYTLIGHSGTALEIVFSPDSSKVAVASSDRTVGLWNTICTFVHFDTYDRNKVFHDVSNVSKIFDTYTDVPEMTRFSNDGSTIAVASEDKAVRLWNTTTGNFLQIFYYSGGFIQELKVLPDQAIVSLSKNESDRLWDPWDTHTFKLTNQSYPLSTTQPPIPDRFLSRVTLHLDKCWVLTREEKVIYIPPEYRPVQHQDQRRRGSWVKQGQMLFIMYSTGKAIFLTIP